MTPDKKRRDLFLSLIDALLAHVRDNARMDVRDRVAVLALADRVLAREKSDDDAEQRGSKVRQYSGAFQATNAARSRAADHPRQPGKPEPDQDEPQPEPDDGEPDDREHERHAAE